MLRKLVVPFVVGALTVGAPVAVFAHHGPMHRAVYRQISGPRWMPDTVAIRCPGWAEDVAHVLTFVAGTSSHPIYRCDLTV